MNMHKIVLGSVNITGIAWDFLEIVRAIYDNNSHLAYFYLFPIFLFSFSLMGVLNSTP